MQGDCMEFFDTPKSLLDKKKSAKNTKIADIFLFFSTASIAVSKYAAVVDVIVVLVRNFTEHESNHPYKSLFQLTE